MVGTSRHAERAPDLFRGDRLWRCDVADQDFNGTAAPGGKAGDVALNSDTAIVPLAEEAPRLDAIRVGQHERRPDTVDVIKDRAKPINVLQTKSVRAVLTEEASIRDGVWGIEVDEVGFSYLGTNKFLKVALPQGCAA